MNNLKVVFWVVMLLAILSISIKPNEAARPVSSDHPPQEAGSMQKQHLELKSLQSTLEVKTGPPAPNGNGCGYIPCTAKTTTTIGEKNFAGHANIPMANPPPAGALPDHIIHHPQEAGWMQKQYLELKSLPSTLEVKYNPPSPNGCGYIPCTAKTKTTTTIGEKNFAGRANIPMANPPPASAFPDHIIHHPQEAGWMQKQHLQLKSLQSTLEVKYNPPSPNGCGYIPCSPNTKTTTTTTIGEKNFAGRANLPMANPPPASALPDHIIQFGAATNRKLL